MSERQGDGMSEQGASGPLKPRLWPVWSVAAALLVCKGLLYGVALLAVLGIGIDIPPGPWAVAVDIAVLIAVAAFRASRKRHGRNLPFALSVLGAGMVIANMHGLVAAIVEWAGLALLVIAAWLDRNARKT